MPAAQARTGRRAGNANLTPPGNSPAPASAQQNVVRSVIPPIVDPVGDPQRPLDPAPAAAEPGSAAASAERTELRDSDDNVSS